MSMICRPAAREKHCAVKQPGKVHLRRKIQRPHDALPSREISVRLKIDPQAFLQTLVQRTQVLRFEIAKPSLYDIFIRIAKPASDELPTTVEVA